MSDVMIFWNLKFQTKNYCYDNLNAMFVVSESDVMPAKSVLAVRDSVHAVRDFRYCICYIECNIHVEKLLLG